MKAIITAKSELSLSLSQHFSFDVLDDEGGTVLTSQSIEYSPSTAVAEITSKLQAYQEEYDKSQGLEVGTEIS